MKKAVISIGTNLKILRKKAGYTRGKLADMISYSEKSIEKWESGTSVPPLETVCRISEVFGVSIDSLVYAQDIEIKYLLAIDGGGSKTEFLLTDINKKEKNHIFKGASNPVDIGIDSTFEILEQGIREVCKSVNLREVSVFAGLAGGMTGDNKVKINEFLSGFNFGCYSNGSDTENVLEIALNGNDGVAVIMGTGIIAFAQSGEKCYRIGGWGYHIDKGGSGYNIASEAINFALKYIDGRKGSRILKELIENKLAKSLPDAIEDIYNGGKAYIASFAPLVFEACDMGDKYALSIIDGNIKEVAEIIETGLEYLSGKEQRVVICGGLVEHCDIMEPIFRKYLGERIKITFSREAVVNGALLLAEKQKVKGDKNA